MSELKASEKQVELCRICGKDGVKLRHLFNDDKLKKQILHKINLVFPQILIHECDPLPKGLCECCEIFLHATYDKLLEFDAAQQELVSTECDEADDGDYLQTFNSIQLLLDRIRDLKTNISAKHRNELYPKQESDTKHCNLKSLLLMPFGVNSLKRLCIDYFNQHGHELLNTYLKFELPPLTEEEDLAELQQQVEQKCIITSGFLKKNQKRGMGGRYSKSGQHSNKKNTNKIKSTAANQKPRIQEQLPTEKEKETVDEPLEELGRGTRRRSRALSRVNYSEDILDAVLMYDKNQVAKRRKLEEKVILESIKEAKRSQLSPPVLYTPKLSNIPKSQEDFKQKVSKVFKSNSSSVKFNFLGASQSELLSFDTSQIIDLNETDLLIAEPELDIATTPPPLENQLFFQNDLLPDEMVYVKHECPLCGLICDDMKSLALHNNTHIRLKIQRYGERQGLSANLRRGTMVIVNGRRIVRCSNCLRTFVNAEQIKQHWNSRTCVFYCKICYLSFHRNPEQIRGHTLAVHGVILAQNRGLTVGPPLVWQTVKMEKKDSDGLKPPALAPLERLVNNLVSNEVQNEPLDCPSPSTTSAQNFTPTGFTLKVKSVSSINAAAGLNGSPSVSAIMSDVPPLHFPQTAKKKTSMAPMFATMAPKSSPAQRATCHICHCSFPNTNSRNSHMKVHKRPSDTVKPSSLPPPLAISVPKMITQYTKVPQQQQSVMVRPGQASAANNYTVKVNIVTRPCGFRYYNRADFLKHRSECKECRYACTQCSKNFQSGSELQMHYMLSHPKSVQYFKR